MEHNVNFFATCMGSTALQDSVISSIKLMQMYGARSLLRKSRPVVDSLLSIQAISKKQKKLLFTTWPYLQITTTQS